MKNYVIAVGGTGAKVVQSMIHLGAAGLLPEEARHLDVILVDPDENNGSVSDCQQCERAYLACSGKELQTDQAVAGPGQLQIGTTDLFSFHLGMKGPWSPVQNPHADTLKEIFHYNQLLHTGSADAELLDLFFEEEELDLPVKQGFRGRPAIGATIFAKAIDFEGEGGLWKSLRERIKNDAPQGACVLLVGSVFGGSGAAGAPTILRLIQEKLRELSNVRLGLILMLPYFQFKTVPGETIQADPAAFPMATAEALKYYHERHFLSFCNTIFAAGEEIPAEMAVPAVGAADQRNEPHFAELVAALGAFRFFGNLDLQDNKLAVAARQREGTLTWADLPYHELHHARMVRRLEHMIVFAVAYRYIFYPIILRCLSNPKRNTETFWVDHIESRKVPHDAAGKALQRVAAYLDTFLSWLMNVSTPRRSGFAPGLVNPNVFATMQSNGWRLKTQSEFNDAEFGNLLVNRASATRFDARSIHGKAGRLRNLRDPGAEGPGRLVRALYEACEIE